MKPVAVLVKSIGGLAPVFVLASCASAPTQEMSNARQSVQAAYDAGAGEYAAGNLGAARDYLARAERELELRYFSRARHDAIVAKSEAGKAHGVALALQEAEDAIAASTLDEARRDEARTLLQEAMNAAREGRDRQAIRLAGDARRKAGATDAGEAGGAPASE